MTATLPFNHTIKTIQKIVKGQEVKNQTFVTVYAFFKNKWYTKNIFYFQERRENIVEIYDGENDVLCSSFYGSLQEFVDTLIDKGIMFIDEEGDVYTKYDNMPDIERLMEFYNIV